jgi:hypothetical protein
MPRAARFIAPVFCVHNGNDGRKEEKGGKQSTMTNNVGGRHPSSSPSSFCDCCISAAFPFSLSDTDRKWCSAAPDPSPSLAIGHSELSIIE